MEDGEITEGLGQEERIVFRKVAIASILATDMKVHFDLTAKLGDVPGGRLLLPDEDGFQDQKDLVQRTLVHAADLSNPVLPTEQCRAWAYRVASEFHTQAENEKSKGLAFAPFM